MERGDLCLFQNSGGVCACRPCGVRFGVVGYYSSLPGRLIVIDNQSI